MLSVWEAALAEHQKASSEILFVIYMHRISSCSWWVGESLVGFIRPWPPTHTRAVCSRVWSSWNESPHLTCSARKWSEKSLLWFGSELLPQVSELGFGACASLTEASDLTDCGDLSCSTGIRIATSLGPYKDTGGQILKNGPFILGLELRLCLSVCCFLNVKSRCEKH